MGKASPRGGYVVPVFVLLALAGGVGCQRAADESAKIVKLAFVTNNTSEFWKIAANGIHKYEREAGVQVDIKMPPNGKTEEQNQIIENLVSQGYDSVAVSVIAPKDQVAALNAAALKTHLITFDSDAADTKRLLYVGHDQLRGWQDPRRADREAPPERREDGGLRGVLLRRQRRRAPSGVSDAVKDHGIEIVEKREDQTDRAKARGNVEDILNARPDLNLVCGLWSYNGPAIAAALEGTGKKGKVLAAVFDEEDGSLKGIRAGTIAATVVQHPFEMGYRSARWMHRLATELRQGAGRDPRERHREHRRRGDRQGHPRRLREAARRVEEVASER